MGKMGLILSRKGSEYGKSTVTLFPNNFIASFPGRNIEKGVTNLSHVSVSRRLYLILPAEPSEGKIDEDDGTQSVEIFPEPVAGHPATELN